MVLENFKTDRESFTHQTHQDELQSCLRCDDKLKNDHWLTISLLAEQLNIDKETICTVIKVDLGKNNYMYILSHS